MSGTRHPFAEYEQHSLVEAARELEPAIRDRAEEIEETGSVPPDLIEAITRRGLFRLNHSRAQLRRAGASAGGFSRDRGIGSCRRLDGLGRDDRDRGLAAGGLPTQLNSESDDRRRGTGRPQLQNRRFVARDDDGGAGRIGISAERSAQLRQRRRACDSRRGNLHRL